MLTETGRVVAIESQGVWVETMRQSTCGSCAVQKGCGHSLLNRIYPGRSVHVWALLDKNLGKTYQLGDEVSISIPEEIILRGSVIVYMIPLFSMMCLALGASSMASANSDLIAMAGALVGFGLGVAVVRWHAWRHRGDVRLQPVVINPVGSLDTLATAH